MKDLGQTGDEKLSKNYFNNEYGPYKWRSLQNWDLCSLQRIFIFLICVELKSKLQVGTKLEIEMLIFDNESVQK